MSSPLRFKSYLTFFFGEQAAKPAALQQSFYVSEIYATGLDPASFWYSDKFRGDQYFVKETTGAGKGFGIVGGVALLSTLGALNEVPGERSNGSWN